MERHKRIETSLALRSPEQSTWATEIRFYTAALILWAMNKKQRHAAIKNTARNKYFR